ncbi:MULTISPECIES: hypothetical protein [unclassified Paenibacillus]|uniref:hypothetical protein n=1 Tax=unclassified Paenibacillus TaxID=185978 RepID=UPI0030F7D6B8
MKEAIKIDLEGYYVGVKHVDDAFSGVVPFYADPPAAAMEMPPETDTAAELERSEEEPQPAGFIVGVPVPTGLYLPRFDLKAWNADNNRDPVAYWSEGLTPEEIAALHPPAEQTELERLQEENTKLKVALAELAEAAEVDKTKTQLALAELAEMIAAGQGGEKTNG